MVGRGRIVALAVLVALGAAGCMPDTTPPSVPTGLKSSSVASTQLTLSWTASTDNVAVAGYRVFRDGLQVATTSTTTYQDSGLTANTEYTFTVSRRR